MAFGQGIANCVARVGVGLSFALLGGCGTADQPGQAPAGSGSGTPVAGFRSADCNGITDADVDAAVGSELFEPAVISDAGCFWQEQTGIAGLGAGMGISTWWYRGSDMGTEREIEQLAGRTLTELAIDGKDGFRAFDDTACSVYVANGGDVITWSIQTMNSVTLPDLCSIVDRLARLSQERVN